MKTFSVTLELFIEADDELNALGIAGEVVDSHDKVRGCRFVNEPSEFKVKK